MKKSTKSKKNMRKNLFNSPNQVNSKFKRQKNKLEKELSVIKEMILGNKFEDSLKTCEKLLKINSANPELLNLYGVVLQNLKNYEKAELIFKRVVKLNPNSAGAHFNYANILKSREKNSDAILSFQKSIALNTNFEQSYYNLANTLREELRLEEAIIAYKKLISLNPNHQQANNNLGATLLQVGDAENALNSYKKSLTINSQALSAWLNILSLLEKLNRLDQMAEYLEKAERIFIDEPADLRFYKALYLHRSGLHKHATEILTTIDLSDLTNDRHTDFLFTKAKCLEKLNNYDGAYTCYLQKSNIIIRSDEFKLLGAKTFVDQKSTELTHLLELPDTGKAQTRPIINQKKYEHSPTFLIGFPRSGTTLLDTILRSHSKVEVIEENEIINRVRKGMNWEFTYESLVENVTEFDVDIARKKYFDEFEKLWSAKKGATVFVDKLPLNIYEIPFIQKIFPEAKYLFALRHPVDAVFSCWTQNFKLNKAMGNLVELESASAFYKLTMQYFFACKDKLDIEVQYIKYENIVDNFNFEVNEILRFLNLQWENGLDHYWKTASARYSINTPSYSQVVKPIYSEAKYRWRNYPEQLKEIYNDLAYWIEMFQYK